MAPPHSSKISNPDSWWQNAYPNNDKIHVQYEVEYTNGKVTDKVKPGDRIRIKNQRGVFIFRCLAHNIEQDFTWIDCFEYKDRRFRAFPIEMFRGPVKAKKSRRKKPND